MSSVDCLDFRKDNSDADDCIKTGGDYQDATHDCVYHVLTSESGTCDAVNAGCRGYVGSTGRNSSTVLTEGFTSSTNAFYTKDPKTALKLSTEALLVGDHSLQISGAAGVTLSADVDFKATTNTLYTVSFWFKALPQYKADQDTPKTVTLKLNGDVVGTFKASNDWRRFEVGPFRAKATATSTLTFEGAPSASYLDNVSLSRLQDVVYVVKDSWKIPAECDQTTEGIPQPQAMLGCREYRDRLGKVADVRQFSHLCSYQSVGCSAFIDTRNSVSAYVQVFPLKGLDKPPATGKVWDTLYSGTVTTTRPADRYIYVIDDTSAHCDVSNASCRAFGKPTFDVFGAPSSTFETVYFKDDITKYVDSGESRPRSAVRASCYATSSRAATWCRISAIRSNTWSNIRTRSRHPRPIRCCPSPNIPAGSSRISRRPRPDIRRSKPEGTHSCCSSRARRVTAAGPPNARPRCRNAPNTATRPTAPTRRIRQANRISSSPTTTWTPRPATAKSIFWAAASCSAT